MLEDLGGYRPLRAHGETFLPELDQPAPLPPLAAGPAARRWARSRAGIISQLAPETRGGGGDAMIDAFHQHGGVIRRRVSWVKALASIFTLGTGGSGGREGPTMQIGGALGSLVGAAAAASTPRERRILMVAGVAAGIAAVFRTPLGAALLAVEVLYRDDFESDALIPAVLASVIAYSVVISIFGESTLFAHPARFPFVIAHLPLYGAARAAGVGARGAVPVVAARACSGSRRRSPIPRWARPGARRARARRVLRPHHRLRRLAPRRSRARALGLLGGGYGAAQVAITRRRLAAARLDRRGAAAVSLPREDRRRRR